jgi:tetratricopeptide (TPR) repeat protein
VLPADAPPLIDGEIVALTMERSVALIQYFGKCLLPFNLNVYPTLHDTSIWYCIASVVLITIGLLLNKTRSPRNIITGMAWFVLFLIPVFLVPAKINNQLYEHRLYLPLIGFLILLSETVLFSTKLPLMIRQTFLLVSISGSIFLIQNYLPAFKDIFSFWKYAVAHSPNDACTNKMFGMKLLAVNRKEEGLRLMFKARGINENEPYTGLFLSQYYYEPKGKLDTARMLLESEIEHNPNIWATYFDLARVCFSVNDLDCAEKNLKTYLEYNPTDQQANFNLTLLLYDRKKYTEAMEQTKQAEKHGVVIEEDLLNLIRKELK